MGSIDTTSASGLSDAHVAFDSHTDAAALVAARRHLEQEGWAVIPDVLTREETRVVRERLWEAAQRFDQEADAADAEGGGGGGESHRPKKTFMPRLDPNASNVRVFYLMALDEIFRDLIRHPVAVEVVPNTLPCGDNYLISNFTANVARPGSKSMALHSDQSLVMPEPWVRGAPWTLNVIWCLDDVYRANGATMYIPGSQNWETRDDIPPNARDLLVPFEAKAGSVILMSGRLWHTSGANVTHDKDRALLFGYYTVPFLRQQVNWSERMSPELKRQLDPDLTQKLGLTVTANVVQPEFLKYLDVQFPAGDAGEADQEK